MTEKHDNSIIDACLDEVLGGQLPPDLTIRILRSLDARDTDKSHRDSTESFVPDVGCDAAMEAATTVSVRSPERLGKPTRPTSALLAIATSLALIGMGGAVVWVTWNATERRIRHADQIASPQESARPPEVAPVPSLPSYPEAPVAPPAEHPNSPVEPAKVPDHSLVIDTTPAPRPAKKIPKVNIPDERPAPLADAQIVRAINELIRDQWESEGIAPAAVASDKEWCDRVFAKLIGREPRPGELSAFLNSRSENKRDLLVDLLLDGDTYVEEFAAHWSRRWADILIGSAAKRTNRDGLEQYLRRAFGEGKSFDLVTSELLTATGTGTIGTDSYNGATNFLIAHADGKSAHTELTVQTSRTFMALSMECTQCHDDVVWSGFQQRKYWELNAFFRQMQVSGVRGTHEVANVDFPGEGETPATAEIYYQLRNGLVRTAYPVFVDDTEIPKSGKLSDVDRRTVFAEFVTRSEQFRQAMANRFWAELFGVGFTIPVDNIGPHNPPSHPELLAKLGGQFAAHNYDVRALIRWIALSEPFALSAGDVATHDQLGAALVFDRFPNSKDTQEPLLKRLQIAQVAYAGMKEKFGVGATPARLNPTADPTTISTELSDVDKLLATVYSETRRLSKSTVYGNYILESKMSREHKIQHMFFATLHRAPSASELKAVGEVLANSTSTSDDTALEYIWWALASSSEAR
ncbi:MAG: DUF1549 domain-containing protein [Planctomycetes bacterium]|nr:DUF1549 domain-containing protein [Planctomycetota bacterium]